MKTLLIVFHSQTGGAAAMAKAVAQGAEQEAGVSVLLRHADGAGPAEVLAADGYVFVTPEYLGAAAGRIKDFFDRSYYAALDQVNGRPYALLVCAGSDGHGAIRQIERIATGWRLKAVVEPLIVCTHAQTPEAILAPKTLTREALEQCRDIGAALAAGLALGIY